MNARHPLSYLTADPVVGATCLEHDREAEQDAHEAMLAEADDECSAEDCCPRHIEEIIRCSTCKTKYFDTDEAEECCPASARNQPMRCPVCLRAADTFEIAADCCLHVHPTMTALGRQRVAHAVAGGIPWPDAVAANIHH